MKQCPRCNSNVTIKRGNYRIHRTQTAQRKFYCKDCKHSFTERNVDFKRKIPLWIRQKIISLYNKNKGYIRKYDAFKKQTYSIREIAKMLNVSWSFVGNIIKNWSNKRIR